MPGRLRSWRSTSQIGELIGKARLHADANHERGEYGILIRSDLKGQGLGWELMRLLMEWARAEGLRVMKGQVFARERNHAGHVP